MTVLEAVNRMLEAIGEPPVTALDTGGTSEAGEAEAILYRVSRQVQGDGWWVNTDRDLEIEVPDTKIVASGGAGTFSYGETVTESVSSATGTFSHELSGSVYLYAVSGTFTGGQTLTGGTSSATRTGSTYTAVTSGRIALDPDWIRVSPSSTETDQIVARGGYFYNFGSSSTDTPTYTFTASIDMDVIAYLDFTDLTDMLAAYIATVASVRFQRYKKRGQVDDAMLSQEAARARLSAIRENSDYSRPNILTTDDALRVKGDRKPRRASTLP